MGRPSEEWGTLKWGGVDEIGDSETFYVSVGRPVASRGGIGGTNVTALMGNGTMVEVEVE